MSLRCFGMIPELRATPDVLLHEFWRTARLVPQALIRPSSFCDTLWTLTASMGSMFSVLKWTKAVHDSLL